MAGNVAGSSVGAATFAVQGASSQQTISSGKGGSSSVVPSDSFKLLVRVANSTGLSGIEKNGLIRDIAFADKFAKPKYQNMRREMMENIASVAAFLEKRAVQVKPAQATSQALARYSDVSRVAAKVDTDQAVARALKNFEKTSVVMTKQPLKNVRAETSPVEIQGVFDREIADVVAEYMPAAQVQSKGDEIYIPGAQKTEYEVARLPGSGDAQQADAFPLPGAAEDAPQLKLPGSGEDVAQFETPQQRLARLEALGLIDLDDFAADRVTEELSLEILGNPEVASAASGRAPLPAAALEDTPAMREAALSLRV